MLSFYSYLKLFENLLQSKAWSKVISSKGQQYHLT